MGTLPNGGSSRSAGRRIALLLLSGVWLAFGAWTAAAQAPSARPANPDAERRVALVIGNSAYRNVAPLDNPMRDADGVASALHKDGFDLVGGRAQINLDKHGMEEAIRSFGRSLKSGAVGLFYYSGHGLEVGGHNYLIPVDGDPQELSDVDFELVDVDLLLKQVRNANNRLTMIVLDACRINPFGNRGLRALGTGLAEIRDRPSGTIISYATAPGKVAADGARGTHSPYTSAFIEGVQKPGLNVLDVFNWVASEVDTRTKGEQQPWLGMSPFHGQFFFIPPGSTVTITTPPGPASSEGPEMMLWSSVKDARNPALLQAYLDQFPKGTFAGAAKIMIEELKRSQMAALPKPEATPPGPAEAAIEEIEGAYITTKHANIREKPLADARLIKSLAPGVALTVTGRVKDSDWYRVASLDKKVHGFLPGNAIQDVGAAEEADWQRVKDTKQSAMVADFLRRYPAGTHVEQAKALRDVLLKDEEIAQRQKAEQADWQRVKDAKQSSAVTGFLKRYPAGAYAEQAKILRDVLVKDEEAAERRNAEEADRKKAEEVAQQQKAEVLAQRQKAAEEAAVKVQQEAAQRQKIVEGDQQKSEGLVASKAVNAESSLPKQQAMIAPDVSKSGTRQYANIPSDLVIPAGTRIIPPDQTISKEIAAFSGVWVGQWSNGRNHALVVTEIRGDTASVIYVYGKFGSNRSGSMNTTGTISNGKLKVSLYREADATYTLNNDGTLSGVWDALYNRLSGQFSRGQYP